MGREWRVDILKTVSGAFLSGSRQTDTGLWLNLDKDLQSRAVTVKRLRKAPLYVLLFVVLSLVSGGSGNGSLETALSAIGGLLIALIVWRITVRIAKTLARDIHLWAQNTMREPDEYLSIPADAGAIYAPWIPTRIGRMGAVFKSAIGRSMK